MNEHLKQDEPSEEDVQSIKNSNFPIKDTKKVKDIPKHDIKLKEDKEEERDTNDQLTEDHPEDSKISATMDRALNYTVLSFDVEKGNQDAFYNENDNVKNSPKV